MEGCRWANGKLNVSEFFGQSQTLFAFQCLTVVNDIVGVGPWTNLARCDRRPAQLHVTALKLAGVEQTSAASRASVRSGTNVGTIGLATGSNLLAGSVRRHHRVLGVAFR